LSPTTASLDPKEDRVVVGIEDQRGRAILEVMIGHLYEMAAHVGFPLVVAGECRRGREWA